MLDFHGELMKQPDERLMFGEPGQGEDVITAGLPLFHVGDTIFCGLSASMSGAELVVMSPFGMRNPALVPAFWRIVERDRVTLPAAVPTSKRRESLPSTLGPGPALRARRAFPCRLRRWWCGAL